jgi:hypothetical protein
MRKAPPLPFLAPEHHGSEILVMAVCWGGEDLRAGEEAIAGLRALGKPLGEAIGATAYVGWQTALDPLLTAGARNYWKSHDLLELSDPAIETMLDAAGRLPTPHCEVLVAQLGGAVNRVPVEATAYPHRDVQFIMNIHTRWTDPADDARCIAWARALHDALAPHATGGVYVNFMPDDEVSRIGGAYGPNYGRLARIKARHDPTNLFRLNQNIQPAS